MLTPFDVIAYSAWHSIEKLVIDASQPLTSNAL